MATRTKNVEQVMLNKEQQEQQQCQARNVKQGMFNKEHKATSNKQKTKKRAKKAHTMRQNV